MLALIIGFAQADDRIRAVLMNGSRVNPNVVKDMFRDYDIVYFVTDVEPFKDEALVVPQFGEAIVVQKPEDHVWPPPQGDGSYGYLMQLADGNRIDLGFVPVELLQEPIEDSLTLVLLDKDSVAPDLPPPSERSYFITEPTPRLYADCCSEFFFGLGSHIPKTLWRRQLPLLKVFIEVVLRKPLVMMLEWDIGVRKGFDVSVGKAGKHLQTFLEPEVWREFEGTYAGADYAGIYGSCLVSYRLFKQTAQAVGQHYGYRYPAEDGEGAAAFLEHVWKLPEDTQSIF